MLMKKTCGIQSEAPNSTLTGADILVWRKQAKMDKQEKTKIYNEDPKV